MTEVGIDPGRLFVIAHNPEPDSKLPYLLRLPLESALILKARDTWPRASRIYCHPFEDGWPADAEVIEETPAASCRRRGAVIDLVLDRPRNTRSQFVFTETRGRPAIFWQTQKAARAANPGGRVPRRRALSETFTISIDTRERYPFRFSGRDVLVERATLQAGDYAVLTDGDVIATVERKTLENFATSLSDGTMAFQLQRLGEMPRAAVVVEARYSALFKLDHVPGGWIADVLARLQVRYPEIQVVFADSRKFAEEWTFRFLASALAEETDPATEI
ncbi:MAG: ERCC4 domain-containing protein [Actinomycetota bacterium]